MKGNNVFTLNQATMIEAVQEYLDKRYSPKVNVATVRANTSGTYGQEGTFIVDVKEIAAQREMENT